MKVKCKIKDCKYNNSLQCTNNEIEINLSCDEYELAYCCNFEWSDTYIKQKYHIEKLLNLEYDYIVFSNSIDCASDYLEYIIKDIKTDKTKIKILFDNLLHCGNNSNRYIYTEYDFVKEDINGYQIANIPKQDIIRKTSVNYYKNKKELIEYSILTSIQKKMILKGLAI